MKINKLLLSLICLVSLQISGFPISFNEFNTDENKKIIILGDFHKTLNAKAEEQYINILLSFFNNQEKLIEHKTMVLLEAPTKPFTQKNICGLNISPTKKNSFINNLNPLITNNPYQNVTFKNADIRTFTKELHEIFNIIQEIEDYSQNNNNFPVRKNEYLKKFNVTIKDYLIYLQTLKHITEEVSENYVELKEISKQVLIGLETQKNLFIKATQKLIPEDSFLKLILQENNSESLKTAINKWTNFIICTDGYVTDLCFVRSILDSLKTNNTIVIAAGDRHASQIKLFLSKKYRLSSSEGATYYEDINNSQPIELQKFNALFKNEKNCTVCFKDIESNQRCSQCKKVYYCSRECQIEDWKFHKKVCKPLEKIESASSTQENKDQQ